ncbi:MAG TPA: type II toxin-antitoxin system VapC family toxin [Geminicoccaceae bacterium]|nr:type II toxin-antitoxin system VapC family toxin [Geminicoccaceae bacterium]
MIARELVVDASVAIKWVLHEPDRDLAYALFDGILLAPDLMLIECANALRSRAARGSVGVGEVEPAWTTICEAPVRISPAVEFIDEALALGVALEHPVYDCIYLALAIASGCSVVTADRRFRAAVRREPRLDGRVVLLSELAH